MFSPPGTFSELYFEKVLKEHYSHSEADLLGGTAPLCS